MGQESTEAEGRISREDFTRMMAEITRLGQLASEYQGSHGSYVKGQIEHFGLNRGALAIVRRTDRMEDAKARDTIRACLQYWWLNGDFDQIDAFDDITILLRRILMANDDGRQTEDVGGDETLDSVA